MYIRNMKSFLQKTIKYILGKKSMIPQDQALVLYPSLALKQLSTVNTENRIDSIIFSKDRAIQLHAFIESYFEKVDGADRLFVLYKATGEHVSSYEELKQVWSGYDVQFIEETDFRKQLNEICVKSTAKLLGFYVDDMIFTECVSYNEILRYNPLEYIVCLSRGLDFTYSQVLNKTMALPIFERMEDSAFYSFHWDYSDEFNDWTYPLGVSAYFYSRHEIVAMFDLIFYKAPNSLESAMQILMPYFKVRKGLCMDRISCCCVPVNMVQEECVNPVTGHISTQGLLEKWNQGLKIDISKFEKVGVKGIYMDYEYITR